VRYCYKERSGSTFVPAGRAGSRLEEQSNAKRQRTIESISLNILICVCQL
jgi:hypothetical protein